MTELTRRQMRELERTGQSGSAVTEQAASEAIQSPVLIEAAAAPSASKEAISRSSGLPSFEQPTSRRQLREQQVRSIPEQASSLSRASALSRSLTAESEAITVIEPAAPVPIERPGRSPLPPVGQSRRSQRSSVASGSIPETIESIEPVDVEIPEEGLRGANYLGEPSTQSIVLDVAPEAMSISVDTGEIFTTGSIAILPDTTGSITGSLDGIDLDTDEAVTGVISIVDPVSARDLIDERSPLGVVPSNVLRKGWWRPWVVGALSIAMAIAAILASLTIFNAIGA